MKTTNERVNNLKMTMLVISFLAVTYLMGMSFQWVLIKKAGKPFVVDDAFWFMAMPAGFFFLALCAISVTVVFFFIDSNRVAILWARISAYSLIAAIISLVFLNVVHLFIYD